MTMKRKQIPLSQLVSNLEWQTREVLNEENIEKLRKAMLDQRTQLPPILVRPGGGGLYKIFDGFHRFEAAKSIGYKYLLAEIFEGTTHEALAEGVTRNLSHGLQLEDADKKKAGIMLSKPGLKTSGRGIVPGSSRWVADKLGVTAATVRKWVNPKANLRSNKKQTISRKIGKVVQKEGREAALQHIKDEALKHFGVEAFSRKYEPVVDWSQKHHKPGSPGTPVLMLSDVHYGEVVDAEQVYNSNSFDIAICERRVKHVFETATYLLKDCFAKPDYEGIVLVLGGDMISGNLHDDHVDTDEVPPLRQCLEISQLVADGVALLASEFKQVTIYCVAGNHGRTTRKPRSKFYAEFNLDWMAYQWIREYTKGLKNVTLWAPNARDLNFVVAGHRYRLTHGDQFRGGDGIIGPIGPITRGDYKKRVTASLMPGQPEAYDTMLCGHFHTQMMLPRLIVNGSVKGYDEYAMSINCPWEPPQQALWTVHPKHGHTWYLPVICDPDYSAHGKETK